MPVCKTIIKVSTKHVCASAAAAPVTLAGANIAVLQHLGAEPCIGGGQQYWNIVLKLFVITIEKCVWVDCGESCNIMLHASISCNNKNFTPARMYGIWAAVMLSWAAQQLSDSIGPPSVFRQLCG